MLGLVGATVRQRNDFYLPGCPVWMFITVYDVIYLRCLISNE